MRMAMNWKRRAWAPALLVWLAACATPQPAQPPDTPPVLTHGTAVGEVSDTGAIV